MTRIENRLYKRLSTGGYRKKTACVNGSFTQAVQLCEYAYDDVATNKYLLFRHTSVP